MSGYDDSLFDSEEEEEETIYNGVQIKFEVTEDNEIVSPQIIQSVNVMVLKCDTRNCGICLRLMKSGTTVQILKCLHIYCYECIQKWLTKSNKCPECRIENP